MPLLRIVADPNVTPILLERISQLGLDRDLLLHRGARPKPVGDEIVVRIARSEVDELIVRLTRTTLPGAMDISMQAERDLGGPGLRGTLRTTPDDSDVVIWTQVRDDVLHQGRLSWVNVLLMVVAAMIAAVGIIQDQLLLLVGAMALSPDYFILAVPCLAAAWRRWGMFWRGLVVLIGSFVPAAAGAWQLTVMLARLNLVQNYQVADHQLIAFISRPDGLSIIVALLAGVAGGLAITLPDARGLVGVFVSVTTIPAAANIGVAAAAGRWADSLGALEQLGVNLAALVVAVTATLAVRRAWHVHGRRNEDEPLLGHMLFDGDDDAQSSPRAEG